jgi:hypothetical protein
MELLLGWLLAACVVAVIAESRGRSGPRWFVISMLASPLIAIILIACLPNRRRERLARHRHEELMRALRPGYLSGPVETLVRQAARQGHRSPVKILDEPSAGQSALNLIKGAAIVICFFVFAALTVMNMH